MTIHGLHNLVKTALEVRRLENVQYNPEKKFTVNYFFQSNIKVYKLNISQSKINQNEPKSEYS